MNYSGSIGEILEPVLNKNGETYWLTRRYKQKCLNRAHQKKSMKDVIKEDRPLKKEPVFELVQQGLWKCQKCGFIMYSNPDKPVQCFSKEGGGCDRISSFKPITGICNPNLFKLPKWKGITDLDMLAVFHDTKDLMRQLVVFPDEISYSIFTLWIISTWKYHCWGTVGFPVFLGLPNSGKTTALLIAQKLGYRAVETSGVTFASIPRLSHYWNVTLLIDEAHNRLNPKTESGSQMLDFVKASYKRGSTYVTCDRDNPEKVIVTNNFGFKAFAGEKSFNPALLSRSFVIWMDKHDPEVPKLSYVQDELDDLQNKLLNYRYKTDNSPDLGCNFILKGRTREIFENIIATGMHIGIEVDNIIEYAQERAVSEEEEFKNTIEYEILTILKNKQEEHGYFSEDSPEEIKFSEIANQLGWDEIEDKDEKRKKMQRLGYILTKNLGLKTKRKSKGTVLFFVDKHNDRRLKSLYRRYKL